MNIVETPTQSEEVLKFIDSKNPWDWPIMKRYPGYEKCFLAFHPFLIVSEGGQNIKIPYQRFPKKKEIVENYKRLKWNKFLEISKIKDIKALDDCLAFYHGARRFTDKNEFKKLINITENDNYAIIEAQVDCFPGILENDLLNFFIKKGYSQLYVYDDINDEKELCDITKLFTRELNDIHHIRIETPDSKVLVVVDLDDRFTYFLGNEHNLIDLTKQLDLEGFYCDNLTASDWSYEIIEDSLKMDRNEYIEMSKTIS